MDSNKSFNPFHLFFYLFASLCFLNIIAWADNKTGNQDSGQRLTLEKSISIALQNNPVIQESKSRVQKAQAVLAQAEANFLPKLSADFYGATAFTAENKDIISANVTLKQPLYQGGRVLALQEKAKSSLTAEKANLLKVKREVTSTVKKAYYKLLTSKELYNLQQKGLEQLQIHLQDVNALYSKGLLAKVEILKVDLALAQAEQKAIELSNELEMNRSAFNQILNRELTATVDIEPLGKYQLLNISFEELMRLGLKNRPELAEIESLIVNNELNIKIARSEQMPQISLLGSYEAEKDVYINTLRGVAALSASMSLWDWGESNQNIEQAYADLEQAQCQKIKVKQNIEMELRKAYLLLNSSQQEIEVANKMVLGAEEYFRMQKIRFKNGQATNTEVLNAQLVLSQAKAYYTIIINAYRITCASSELVLGIDALDEARNLNLTDEEFLDLISQKAFQFFWDNQSLVTGLFADSLGGDASIAATGFGLVALCIGAERGWVNKSEAEKRALLCLNTFLANSQDPHHVQAEGKNGFFYHFLDMETAKRVAKSEVSTVDTALLICGAVTAGEYFSGRVKTAAEQVYQQADWNQFLDQSSDLFYMGWDPATGFLPYRWDVYTDELILITLLAIGSSTYPIDPKCFYAWLRKEDHYQNNPSFICSWQGALFTYQYAHIWFDFRNLVDKQGVNWWQNSIDATKTGIAFCLSHANEFKGFGQYGWGITSYDTPESYVMNHGFPPCVSGHPIYDGTISPSGVAGSMVFTPMESLEALRNFYNNYPQIWGLYGFKSSLNLDQNWYSSKYFGLDQGLLLTMIENFKSDFIWKLFMQNPNVKKALHLAGFQKSLPSK